MIIQAPITIQPFPLPDTARPGAEYPPATQLARTAVLNQLGASSVAADGMYRVVMTYDDNAAAANADALLRDQIDGVELVIRSRALTPDAPIASAQGIADVLRGVNGLEVYVGTPRGGSPTPVLASSPDASLVKSLQALVNQTPAPGIELGVFHKPGAALPA